MRFRRQIWNRRAKESLGILMVGDGLLATVGPVRHCLLWQRGPVGWRRLVSFFAERPGLAPVVGVAETGAGLWLASRQWSA